MGERALNGKPTLSPPVWGSHILRFHRVLQPILGTLHGVPSHPYDILGGGRYWTITVIFKIKKLR